MAGLFPWSEAFMSLRVVLWNCNMALDRKWQRLMALRPDVAVGPESADPDVRRRKAPRFTFSDCEWEGWYKHKGLAVFSFGEYALRMSSHDRQYQIFMPLEVRGPHSFHLLAVWAFNSATPPRAVTNSPSIRAALAHYAPFLTDAPSVVAGDFNSSSAWDKPIDSPIMPWRSRTFKNVGLRAPTINQQGVRLVRSSTRPCSRAGTSRRAFTSTTVSRPSLGWERQDESLWDARKSGSPSATTCLSLWTWNRARLSRRTLPAPPDPRRQPTGRTVRSSERASPSVSAVGEA